jgi:hypothetical protein
MRALNAMLRKQKVEVDLQKQQLHALQQRHSAADRDLQDSRAHCSESERYLRLQLTDAQEISLDRLTLARRRHGEQQEACTRAERFVQELANEMQRQEQALQRAEKTLEKLAEILSERRREAAQELQKQEWQQLDEQILATRRQRAL